MKSYLSDTSVTDVLVAKTNEASNLKCGRQQKFTKPTKEPGIEIISTEINEYLRQSEG